MRKSVQDRLKRAAKPQYFEREWIYIVHGGDLKPRRAYYTESAAIEFANRYSPNNRSIFDVQISKVRAADVAAGVA